MFENNKAVMTRFYEAWNARDLDAFEEIFAPDAVDHDMQNPFAEIRGAEGARRTAEMYHAGYPDSRIEVHELISEGDLVVSRWTGKGTNDGELMGIAPTGRSVTVAGITIARIASSKISETWTCWDALGMMQQLGVAAGAQARSV